MTFIFLFLNVLCESDVMIEGDGGYGRRRHLWFGTTASILSIRLDERKQGVVCIDI